MSRIKVGFFGFGKTGKDVVREFLNEEKFDVCWVVRKTHQSDHKYASRLVGLETDQGEIFSIEDISKEFFINNFVDLIVDFSSRQALESYAQYVPEGTRLISAISNYEEYQLNIFHQLKEKIAVLYSPNITLGVNFLLVASKLLSEIAPHADVEIVEEHFRGKNEISGTALRIAEALGLDKKKHVNSIRVGGIIGKHEVVFGFPNQTVRLVHESINRKAFGQGAIFAAKWLITKSSGLFSMENIISDMMREKLPVY